MRVLTFNSHQPYLHLLSTSLPWVLGVVTPRLPSGKIKSWNDHIRPLPENVRVYSSMATALEDSRWDWILTHNVHDLLDVRDVNLPKVFLVHGTLSGRILQDRSSIDREKYIGKLRLLLEASRTRVVYISRLKQDDWGIPGRVIHSTVNPKSYGGYRGEIQGILQVCNHLRDRGAMLGYAIHQAVCRNLPHLVLGENPALPSSRGATSWEDLKEQYRSYRVYLHTAVYPYEDGFNLALLEAMATGMPVATIAHPTSPIEDGLEGVVASSAAELHERVGCLLANPEEALRMGNAARKKLELAFPFSRFQSEWQSLAAELATQ